MVYELVDHLILNAGQHLLGIGIGAPGLVDHTQGIIHRAVNVEWQEIPLRDLLAKRYNIPVAMANDCQVAALGEYTFGNRDKNRNLAVINIGYGVGAGIIINGQLLPGNPYGAGEIGHVKVVEDGEPCSCGNTGCLETVTSTRSIFRRIRALAPGETAFSDGSAAMDELASQFAAGTPVVNQVIRETARYLAIAVSHLIGVLGPCQVVIAGSIASLGSRLAEMVMEELLLRYRLSLVQEVCIDVTHFGADLVVLGGCALVLPRELGAL
jgi:N-acetylglucosamine repressor